MGLFRKGKREYRRIEKSVRSILEAVGEDPDRQGLQGTPDRIARMLLDEVLVGYQQDLEEIVNNAIFDIEYDQMVVVRDIDVYSMCEHHMLPFFGVAHVAYIPRGKIIGLSKIPRIVDYFARRLQVQERLTVQIANALQELLDPRGVAVVIEAIHLCSVMRGVRKPRNKMVTSEVLGLFRSDLRTREEFMAHIGRPFTLND